MLVYANVLQLTGEEALDVCLRVIHGWLVEQLGLKVPLADIARPGEWKSDQGKKAAWLKSYVATGEEPEMYAWRLKHADAEVSGRQWLVEIGLKQQSGVVDLSCAINTDEQSVLINQRVSASRPKLIRYLLDNLKADIDARFVSGTVGTSVKMIGESFDSYRGLLSDIQRSDRDYPIVLVSPDKDAGYLVNPQRLQEHLLGLAQVVRVHPDFSSWDMEAELSRRYSAWDGAITVIKTPNRDGTCYSNFYLSNVVEGWGEEHAQRLAHMLALITHLTNVPKQRRRVRPDGVARLELIRRLSRQRQELREKGGSEQGMIELLETGLGELTEQNQVLQEKLGEKELEFMQLEDEKEAVDQELRAERFNLSQLKQQLQTGASGSALSDIALFMDIASRADQPSPKECLDAVAKAYPDRVVVLDSAYGSARKHDDFDSGRRLLGMLNKLVTSFVDEMLEGGDDRARQCFANSEYAATESEGTQNNKEMRKKRTFTYRGRDIEMWRHLKIGVADDKRKSIRVHFEWVPDESKIVIGHCGAHLPVISH